MPLIDRGDGNNIGIGIPVPGKNLWLSVTGIPAAATGAVGDVAYDNSTGNVYQKIDNTTWQLLGNIRGDAGIGFPTGGTTGQVATKLSATDFDIDWQDQIGVEALSGSTGLVGYNPGTNNITETDISASIVPAGLLEMTPPPSRFFRFRDVKNIQQEALKPASLSSLAATTTLTINSPSFQFYNSNGDSGSSITIASDLVSASRAGVGYVYVTQSGAGGTGTVSFVNGTALGDVSLNTGIGAVTAYEIHATIDTGSTFEYFIRKLNPPAASSGIVKSGLTTGTGAAYVLTNSSLPTLVDGDIVAVRFHTTNTTDGPTININAEGAQFIVDRLQCDALDGSLFDYATSGAIYFLQRDVAGAGGYIVIGTAMQPLTDTIDIVGASTTVVNFPSARTLSLANSIGYTQIFRNGVLQREGLAPGQYQVTGAQQVTFNSTLINADHITAYTFT